MLPRATLRTGSACKTSKIISADIRLDSPADLRLCTFKETAKCTAPLRFHTRDSAVGYSARYIVEHVSILLYCSTGKSTIGLRIVSRVLVRVLAMASAQKAARLGEE